MIKRIMSVLLVLVISVSVLCISPLTAGAKSYKDRMIDLIMKKNLIEGYHIFYYFADLNLDGRKEFIVVNDPELSQCTVYYMKGSKLKQANGCFSGPRNKLYYDTSKQSYVWNASESKLLRSGIFSYESGNINETFSYSKGKIYSNMYSSRESVLINERTQKYKKLYYKGCLFNKKSKTISKSQYDSLNKRVKKNYVCANSKIKLIDIFDLDQYSNSFIRKQLSQSYDAFSYKKMPKLNHKTATIKRGKTLKLVVKNKKGNAKYSSSNKSIATVNSKGVVKAKKVGKATISVKNNGITIKCVINVKK